MWKFVIMQFATLNSNGGKINLLVQPTYGFNCPVVETEDSTARITVVPTAQTFFLCAFAEFTILQVSAEIKTSSLSILCLVRSSTSTVLKVPKPTCKVSGAKCTPLISNFFSNSLLKCKPAVGAATAPSFFANTVW